VFKLFVHDLDICRKYIHSSIILGRYKYLHEIERDELLAGAYSEIDHVTGNQMVISTESLALNLIDHEEVYKRKIKPYQRDVAIISEALNHLNESELSSFYYAINHDKEIHKSKELQLIIMKVGVYIEKNHHINVDSNYMDKRINYINKLIKDT